MERALESLPVPAVGAYEMRSKGRLNNKNSQLIVSLS
jgi:hypothetical protein